MVVSFPLLHWLWSDLYSCFAPWLCSDHFEFGFMFDRFVRDVCQTTWPGLECCWGQLPVIGSASPLLLAPHKHHHLLSVSAWGAAGYLEHWICVDNSPCPSSARCRNDKKGQNLGRQKIKKHITLQISPIIVWREAVVRLEGFGPLHSSWKYICYSGAKGRQLERSYMIWWIGWGRTPEPFTVCKMGLFPHSALQSGIKKILL